MPEPAPVTTAVLPSSAALAWHGATILAIRGRPAADYARRVATDARERILEAACDLIASDGIDDVRIARVANRARASTALVHHYFSTREELLAQALTTRSRPRARSASPRRPRARPRPTGWRGRSTPACRCPARRSATGCCGWSSGCARARRVAAPARRRSVRPLREWIAAAIEAGVESGEFAVERDAAELADLAVALIDGAGVRALIRDPEMDVERARELVAELLCDELGGSSALTGSIRLPAARRLAVDF